MLDRLIIFFGALALFSGLVLPTILPEIANVSTLVFMALGLFVLMMRSESRAVLLQPAVYLSLTACGVLTIALLFTAATPMHVVAIFTLAPIIFTGSLAGLWSQLGDRLTPTLIGSLALVGTMGGLLVAIYEVFVRNAGRGGWSVNNPIHLADLTVALGFVSVVGIFGARKWWRSVFLLGPAIALATGFMSGSRGPVLAVVPLIVVSAATLAILLLPRKYLGIAIGSAVALTIFGGFALFASGLGGRLATLVELANLVASGSTADSSISERLYMYQSAWNAFWASPWYGFGMIDYTASAAQYAPSGPKQWPIAVHLHNDIANFAVIGGVMGIASYLLFLAAPMLNALHVRGPWRGPVIYLGAVLPCGYFAMGLTNAMIGILTQTTVYAVILALIATLSSRSNNATDLAKLETETL